jgi:hypothetical protein
MGLLDWIRNRNVPKAPEPDLDPKAHGHESWKGVFAEIRGDEAPAKRLDETGREPLDWVGPRGKAEEPANPSRTHSIFSDYPDRVLKTETDVKKDDALLEMTVVVNEIANDPDTNWRRYKGDFEKAVIGMREAFDSHAPVIKESNQPFVRGDRSEGYPQEYIQPVWISGAVKRWVREAEENNHFTVYTEGLIGKSSQGFHHRMDVTFVRDEFERADREIGAWSPGLATQEAASREMKSAMVAQDRHWAEWTGNDKGAGSQSIAAVNEAVKRGRNAESASPETQSLSRKENRPQIRAKANYWDR